MAAAAAVGFTTTHSASPSEGDGAIIPLEDGEWLFAHKGFGAAALNVAAVRSAPPEGGKENTSPRRRLSDMAVRFAHVALGNTLNCY